MDLFIALLPAIVLIILVITTRKVMLSLSVGVILAALIQFSFNPIKAGEYLFVNLFGILTSWDWYLPILGFVVLIGGITSAITLTGGVKAFANWSVSKVKSPKAAKMLAWFLGILIFIDDYFNALVIGEITKPITDKYRVSRANLSYIIDSTSAPVVILMPLSTWGGYILGIIGDSFNDVGYQGHTAIGAFVAAIPFQFYPITALIMVFVSIQFKMSFGMMRKFEISAINGNDESMMALDQSVPEEEIHGEHASHWNLILPIIVLIFMTLFMMLVNAKFVFTEFLNQEITLPLLVGGLSAFVVSLIFAFSDKAIKPNKIGEVAGKGMYSMLKSAVFILVLAWLLSTAIQDLNVGDLVAEYIIEINLNADFLPFILFFIAGGLAFSTGTSWGAFGVLLPIAIPIAAATDPALMPLMIASVLGGAVFGDHSSPVSDTTVLSATGARSSLHAHFISQLPYAFTSAIIAALGYLLYALTGIVYLSYILIIILMILLVKIYKTIEDEPLDYEIKT